MAGGSANSVDAALALADPCVADNAESREDIGRVGVPTAGDGDVQ